MRKMRTQDAIDYLVRENSKLLAENTKIREDAAISWDRLTAAVERLVEIVNKERSNNGGV